MTDYFVENHWTCSACDTVNLGRNVRCVSCGDPKEANEKDSMGAGAVTDPALIALAEQKAHWSCEHCGSKQRDPNGNCLSCAAPRADERPSQPWPPGKRRPLPTPMPSIGALTPEASAQRKLDAQGPSLGTIVMMATQRTASVREDEPHRARVPRPTNAEDRRHHVADASGASADR